MAWNKIFFKSLGVMVGLSMLLAACSISYKFNGSSIDYTKIKTISFETFPNRSIRPYRISICNRHVCNK